MTTTYTDCTRTKRVLSEWHELLVSENLRGIQDVWLIEFVSSDKLLVY